ncbi:CU044_5270 family protein [Streptomyces sp. NBC_00568]|uniref:CU044_5270 family protein n=1 Tax=Streptomyces sp. NBC_00568 TaxID=2975779 RepID=UPI002255B848|nr:CU044_5270 family protein [Streptomyces sp. NBC_00568]MCX4993522.1 CU044_5270 family protein [Streptomyces sp. NBC_00568]
MTPNPPHSGPATWDETAALLPAPMRALPADRHEFHKETLMSKIAQDREAGSPSAAKSRGFRLPRPAITVPVTAFALAAVVTAGVAFSGKSAEEPPAVATGPLMTTKIGAGSVAGVPALLNQIATAASKDGHPAVKADQFVYVESKTASTSIKTVDNKSTVVSEKPYKRQVWASPDGVNGWLIDPTTNESAKGETLNLPDEQGNTPKAGFNHPSYDFLANLTTDPDELLKLIYKETKGQGNSPEQQAFATIGDLLGETYPPAALSAALFKTAAKIPGVVLVKNARDAAGREGIAVARLDEASGQREEWIFNKETYTFLGQRILQVNQASGEDSLIKPGTITFTSAIVQRTIVSKIKEVPSQTA